MDRIPEPELMDDEAQARAYADADFAEPHDLFVRQFAAGWPLPPAACRGPILDLGCGPADVVVRLSRTFPAALIHGVDGSAAMLRHAATRLRREGLTDRVVLVHAQLQTLVPPLPAYPIIVSNSLLHHLHDPQVLWSTVQRCAAARGHLFVMDLLRPPTRADVDRLVDRYARGASDVLRRDFRASLSAAFTIAEVKAQLHQAGLSDLTTTVVSDRHFTVRGTLHAEAAS